MLGIRNSRLQNTSKYSRVELLTFAQIVANTLSEYSAGLVRKLLRQVSVWPTRRHHCVIDPWMRTCAGHVGIKFRGMITKKTRLASKFKRRSNSITTMAPLAQSSNVWERFHDGCAIHSFLLRRLGACLLVTTRRLSLIHHAWDQKRQLLRPKCWVWGWKKQRRVSKCKIYEAKQQPIGPPAKQSNP